jgi:RNA ligase (TIGR02306 family)
MERKLASIQKIREILPIEGADSIELAVVNSWNVVIAKNLHNAGDLVVYCEIDSFLPVEPEFEFLRKSSLQKMEGVEGFRLKTIKLRGQVSQGLILPLNDAYAVYSRNHNPDVEISSWIEGTDVTGYLGIAKYEKSIPVNLAGVAKGNFPGFLHKTDEERVQNLTAKYAGWLRDCDSNRHVFYATEKLDGSSATFYINNGTFGVCSRNLELVESESAFWRVARQLDLENKLASLNVNICLQGELIGEGIQGNPYKITGNTVYFFNAFLIDTQQRLDPISFSSLIRDLGLQATPVIENFKLPETIAELLNLAEGKSKLNPTTEREGIVIRSLDTKISFKAISNKFLLKHEN